MDALDEATLPTEGDIRNMKAIIPFEGVTDVDEHIHWHIIGNDKAPIADENGATIVIGTGELASIARLANNIDTRIIRSAKAEKCTHLAILTITFEKH